MTENKFFKVCVIILNWNKEKFLHECLESLKRQFFTSYKIIVWDNGSIKGSLDKLTKEFPEVDFIFSEKNLGFAEGNNRAIEESKKKYDPPYYFLLNNDTIADEKALLEIMNLMESDQKIGVVGPKILCYPDKRIIWAAGGELIKWRLMGKNRGAGDKDNGQYNKAEEQIFVSGCAMLIKKEVFETAELLDQKFFAYLEDLDFCLRAKRHGWKIFYQPKTIIYHYGSITAGGEYSSFQSFYRWRNRLLLINNQAPFFHKIFLFFIFFPVLMARDTFRYFKKGLFKEYKQLWMGLIDFIFIKIK